MSVVKLESVDLTTKTVCISGLDLVDGTPVLGKLWCCLLWWQNNVWDIRYVDLLRRFVDIKPYISVYDSHPAALFPEWIESTAHTAREVRFLDEAREQLATLRTHLRFYADPDDYVRMIEQLLPLDIRSVRQG